jgi:ferredoxin
MSRTNPVDDWLQKRLVKYERWLEQGRIPFSSKVIPVNQSLETAQTVMPSSQILEYLRQARAIALGDCDCRTHFQRCDGPREVCLFLDQTADQLVQKGKARFVTFEIAAEKLSMANDHGLVHLTLCNPDQYPYAICSCCKCCCHDLQFLLDFGRTGLVARSDFIAVHDSDVCVECGICADRCVFEARSMANGALTYDPGKCYGCGLCITTCPTQAIRMEPNSTPAT